MSPPLRKAPAGVISGFTIDTNPSNTEFGNLPTLVTLDDVLTEFANIRRTLDPERIRQLQELIYQHTLDHNNPHETTIGDLILDVTHDALLPYMPGVAPRSEPRLSLDAALSALAPWSCSRPDPVYVTGVNGMLELVPAYRPAIDRFYDEPELVLWASRKNRLTNNDVLTSEEGDALNAIGYALAISGLRAPNNSTDYAIIRDKADNDAHGYRLQAAVLAGEETVTSFYVFPLRDSGVLALRLNRPGGGLVLLDLASGVLTSEGVVIGLAKKLVTGWWRLGVQYLAASSETLSIDMLWAPSAEQLSYAGNSSDLFAVWGPCHGPGRGFGPYIETRSGEVTVAGGAVSVPLLTPPQGMLQLRLRRPAGLKADARLLCDLAGGELGLTHAGTDLALHAAPQFTDARTLTTGWPRARDRLAVSWSPSRLNLVGSAGRQQASLSQTLSPGASLTFYPSDWRLSQLALYGEAETSYELDFLSGVNTQ